MIALKGMETSKTELSFLYVGLALHLILYP